MRRALHLMPTFDPARLRSVARSREVRLASLALATAPGLHADAPVDRATGAGIWHRPDLQGLAAGDPRLRTRCRPIRKSPKRCSHVRTALAHAAPDGPAGPKGEAAIVALRCDGARVSPHDARRPGA